MAMKNQKYLFLQALILTLLIFNIGIYMGYKLESSRINKINNLYLEAEMDLLDQRIQRELFDLFDLNCDDMIQANINFADKIFEEAKKIKKFEDANRINNEIVFQHKRFDLLRTLFWMNSIKLKETCKADYHNIVYFYNFDEPSLDEKAKQRVFSNFLSELKEEYGGEIMLIPIAVDTGAPSIELVLKKYGVSKFPMVLIDENIQIKDVEELPDIQSYLQ